MKYKGYEIKINWCYTNLSSAIKCYGFVIPRFMGHEITSSRTYKERKVAENAAKRLIDKIEGDNK